MSITKAEFSAYIRAFRFKELFNEMGWNHDPSRQSVAVDDELFHLVGVAGKSGFKIFTCQPPAGQTIPDAARRKKIEGQVTKLFQEHLLIFIDEHRQEQVWQLAVRKAGSPTKISETRYRLAQDPELLYQRAGGLFFTLDEEEKVTIIDVTQRVADNFQQNNERVTKKFYESFKKEHGAFLKFIQGIDDQAHTDWYASLMLNRLMFCYFIQKKGFLDNNKNYLQDKLQACREKRGKNKFYSFYRDFLLALFHQGLGAPEHSKHLEVEVGKIPYLNGGLFDQHQIEKTFHHIVIEDQAFEKLFDFFDQYEWHLDTRASAGGKEINPDVIGYIFEKYINDRAQMGAYYTKEDITDYIAKNCILPWLFDEVKRQYAKGRSESCPFAADGWLWRMVKTSGDEYIYDAVKHGVPDKAVSRGGAEGAENAYLFADLPAEIQNGFAPELEKKPVDGCGPWLWELRKAWNKPAPAEIALPTETYREVIERRRRYAELTRKIELGEVREINDFITYNLNIRQFAQDVLETGADAEFIRYFYKALSRITILDPTCGSGAFLFAALNILEPLYEACIRRMQYFVEESAKGKHKFFEETLTQVNAPEHPNLAYFIYKSIILNNLYGVDIMNEAVEIAKLRLFLKLVATVDADYRKPNLGLEPLPDVDFNIRAGNTLVGYAGEAQLKKAFVGKLDFDGDAEKIKEKCDIVGRAFARYKEIQLHGSADFQDFREAKDDLNRRLDKLRQELDKLLHKQQYTNVKYDPWQASHQPFHWFAEFYEIVQGRGGFDVIIGNPPYVEYSDVCNTYLIKDYFTENCGSLFAYTMERSYDLLEENSRFGFIVPISSICTPRMKSLVAFERRNSKQLFVSHYAVRPDKLFSGADMNLTIHIAKRTKTASHCDVYSSNYLRWYTDYRDQLFPTLRYGKGVLRPDGLIYKVQSGVEHKILKTLSGLKQVILPTIENDAQIYYHSGGRYFRKCILEKLSNEYKPLLVPEKSKYQIISLYSSSLYFWYWVSFSDTYHVTKPDMDSFRYPESVYLDQDLSNLGKRLIDDLDLNRKVRDRQRKDGSIQEEVNYVVSKSKPIIDQIDCLLARHYGFTHEELDFILHYDIKYRMGKEKELDQEEN